MPLRHSEDDDDEAGAMLCYYITSEVWHVLAEEIQQAPVR